MTEAQVSLARNLKSPRCFACFDKDLLTAEVSRGTQESESSRWECIRIINRYFSTCEARYTLEISDWR
jgi:hypothetical protein